MGVTPLEFAKHTADTIDNESARKAPPYYRTAGIQPIDIMKKLMTPAQYEGFLWGNLIKYVYRYGRKDDKAGTARKIADYAKWLAELGEKTK